MQYTIEEISTIFAQQNNGHKLNNVSILLYSGRNLIFDFRLIPKQKIRRLNFDLYDSWSMLSK